VGGREESDVRLELADEFLIIKLLLKVVDNKSVVNGLQFYLFF
jgi:hypothetical protein